MKLQILGSGGGEGYPALFCECAHCKAARKAGGKSLRSLSQSLIDGKLLIDLPATTLAHCLSNGFGLGHIEHMLITHTHADHFAPQILDTRGGDYAHDLTAEKLHIYGNADVTRRFNGMFALFPIGNAIRENIVLHTVQAFVPFVAGEYTVTPLKANHAPEEDALNYIIDNGDTALLYLVDTGYPTDETLAYIKNYGKKFGCVVMDATMGVNYYERHMNFAENKKLKETLCKANVCNDNTEFVIAHITHNHAGLHEEIEKHFEGSGITVSYDGFAAKF
ncbi:MAG: hypothetical protein K2L51_02925 [Clostridiales bacterium]|nr:hypothetical protein [Clostridiales bacterium]